MPKQMPHGAYDHPLTRELERAASEVGAPASVVLDEVSSAEVAAIAGRHLAAELARIISALPQERRVEQATAIVNQVLESLPRLVDESGSSIDDEPVLDARLAPPARRLISIHVGATPARPQTPLASSTLFTRGRGEPGLGGELSHEIACSDRVDVLVAFITTGGVRQIRDALEQLAARAGLHPRIRVLTTTFTGTTEVEALDVLASLPGAEVKVSYDTRRTRLHAKAWLFHRETGLTTAYVGSANLTATALGAGHEWMVKLSAADLPHVVEKFAGTFETLWSEDEFERYDPADRDARARLAAALRRERSKEPVTPLTFVTMRPFPFQEAILDRLQAERELLGHRRNLVVAATGTGKTVIAAFDYKRLADAQRVRPRLLFVAHRLEILTQALATFRGVFHDGAFGELHGGTHDAARGDHVFTTVQSAAGLLARFPADHWSHVIIDECHHLPADSYRDVVSALAPAILVGLTATPERTDGKSLLPDFGGRIAAELRIWQAMEQQLLAPFEYYGLADGTDLRSLRWSRRGYDEGALAGIYTGNHARARLVLKQLERRVSKLGDVRGLGFCVTVEHAEFMASFCTAAGVPAIALHGKSPEEERRTAPGRLRDRVINLIFTCDLYNEGVDLPFVDTILLLRPTMSATLFLQQLGRGLRLDSGKTSCLVLDFIGQHREEFRFDAPLAALTGTPRARLAAAVQAGFPFLPSGCSLTLDHVARDQILASLRRSVAGAQRLAAELRQLTEADGRVGLARFVAETGRELEDVYSGDHGWAEIERRAEAASPDDAAVDLSRRFGQLLHVDEPTRLRQYRTLTEGAIAASGGELERRRWMMLDVQLHHRGVIRAAEETVRYLGDRTANLPELKDLTALLEEQIAVAADVYPVAEWPLALHRHYSRREILAAVGHLKVGGKVSTPVGGVMQVGKSKRELLFVTLDKSGKDFSPTTRYRDYAISRERFHWETQGAASVSRPSGRRYLDSPGNGWSFHLFVRTDPEATYAYAGPVEYVSHAGDRPIGIVWRLMYPLPAVLHDRYRSLAQG